MGGETGLFRIIRMSARKRECVKAVHSLETVIQDLVDLRQELVDEFVHVRDVISGPCHALWELQRASLIQTLNARINEAVAKTLRSLVTCDAILLPVMTRSLR